MYRENSLVKIEEDNASFFKLWKNWWHAGGQRLPNERKTFEFILPSCSFTKFHDQFHTNQNETVYDLYDRKVVLSTTTVNWLYYLELSFFDFSRKYRKDDFVSLKIKNEVFVFKIIDVQYGWESIFKPPTITKLICENKFI